MNKKWWGALVLVAVLLGSCKGMKENYDQTFIKSWKEGFVKSCVGQDETKRELCACVADKAVERMSVSQLSNANESIKYIQEKILPECQAK
jgi:hypothetical protein